MEPKMRRSSRIRQLLDNRSRLHSQRKIKETESQFRQNCKTEHPSTSKLCSPLENAQSDCSSGNEEYLLSESSRCESDSDDGVLTNSFKQKLIACFVGKGINNIQGDAVLRVLKSHHCFSTLPKDMKTLIPELLDTPKSCISESVTENSEQGFDETLLQNSIKSEPHTSFNTIVNASEVLPEIEKLVDSRFDKLSELIVEQFQILHSEIKTIKNSVCFPGGKVPNKPSYLPFQTIEEFEQFDNVTEEEYHNMIQHNFIGRLLKQGMNKRQTNPSQNHTSRNLRSLYKSKGRKHMEAKMRRSRIRQLDNRSRLHSQRKIKETESQFRQNCKTEHPSTSKLCSPLENAQSDCSSGNEEYLLSESSRCESDSDDGVLTNSFKQKLIACFVENGINNIQGDAVLRVLKSHHCFSTLPKDMKTLIPELLNTPKSCIPESVTENSEQGFDETLLQNSIKSEPHTSFNTIVNASELLPEIEKLVDSRFDKLPELIVEQFQILHSEIKTIKNSVCFPGGKVPNKPSYLPFQTIEEFEQFDNVTEEEYHNMVSFLTHIGGWTARSCANNILKESIKDEAFVNVTFVGWNGKHSFQKSRFSTACEEAMAQNVNFKITNASFNDAMTDALRSSKQRVRNKIKATQGDTSQRRAREDSKEIDETHSIDAVHVLKKEENDG